MILRDDLKVLVSKAEALLQAGRDLEAIDAYQNLLEKNLGLPDCWYNLAFLQHRARQYQAALRSYNHALQYGVSSPEEVHLNRAAILAEHLGQSDEAVSELDIALTLNPRFVPAIVNLGNLYEQAGDRERAHNAYERVLSIDPNNALALSRLAGLRLMMNADDPLIEKLGCAIARPGVSAAERADLGFGLGKALDSAAEYDCAFAAYVAANEASRISVGPNGPKYSPTDHEDFVDRLIRAFPEPIKSKFTNLPEPMPIFVCGMFRSGSTLVEQILASHVEVTAGGEFDLLPAMARDYLLPLLNNAVTPIEPGSLLHLRSVYLSNLSARFPGAKWVTDKRPDNFLNIGLIKILFPDAKIVHTRRNPVDNCLSVYFLHLSHSMAYAHDLLDTAHWYQQYERLMQHWKSLYPNDIFDVDYDALVADFEPNVRQLLQRCELSWDESCLRFHLTKTRVATPSAWQVRQPLYARSSGRWRNYERHLGALRAVLEPGISR